MSQVIIHGWRTEVYDRPGTFVNITLIIDHRGCTKESTWYFLKSHHIRSYNLKMEEGEKRLSVEKKL
ncbi:hypothetical protein MKX01_004335 [Papaver californicum]|nr:hypothetical protein MKX01_004335 [Papaver californicum]